MELIKAGALSIAIEMAGSGPPIVLLHGIGSNRMSWEPVLRELSARFTVIAWDAPGYGDSTDPPNRGFVLKDYADALEGVIHELGLKSISILGHSFGAMIALEFYRRYSSRVLNLILADATLGHGLNPRRSHLKKERLKAWMTMQPKEFAKSRVPRLLSSSASDEMIERSIAVMSMLHRNGYKVAVETLYEHTQEGMLGSIRVPTLVLCGQEDVVTPVELSQHISSEISGSALGIIPNSGHLSYVEQPVLFCQQVAKFLQTHIKEAMIDERDSVERQLGI